LQDLKRAGIEQAHSLVVLTDARESYTGKGHDSVTVDRDKMLALVVATNLRKEHGLAVQIIVHMTCESNLLLVGPGRFHNSVPMKTWSSVTSLAVWSENGKEVRDSK